MKEHHAFLQELRTSMEGEVKADPFCRQIYSVDASIYEIEPIVIALPKTIKDVQTAIQIAHYYSIPIIPRGAATGTTGGAIGKGLIIDHSKYLHHIHTIDIENKFVRCEPGVVQDQLNTALSPYGYRLGPDTSTGNRATLGGMLANNAAGAHSLKYGTMADHIEEVQLLLSNGTSIRLGPIEQLERTDKCQLKTIEGGIYRTLEQIVKRDSEEIRQRFPHCPRHVSGYHLDELIKPGPVNFAKIIAGAEGTLGFTTELRLKIVEKPQHTGLSVLLFDNLQAALHHIPEILSFRPFSVEAVDKKVIELGRQSPSMKGKMEWLQGNPGAILLIEFEGQTETDAREKHAEFISWAASHPIGYSIATFFTQADKDNIWALRKAGVGLIMSRRTYAKAIAFVEDLAVPPEKLSSFVEDFSRCLHKRHMEAGFYGHAGDGCLHVRPFVDMRKAQDRLEMKSLMEEMTGIILSYKGALSGEHGDGLVRSWLNERLFGTRIYQAFKDVKQAFDPAGIMNPGKIIAAQGLLDNLRVPLDSPPATIPTFLDFAPEGGFAFAIEMCNGNGQCRKREGLMCPTFQAYGDEYHSTRARAQSLRAIINSKIPVDAFTSQDLYNVLDFCIECKGCKTECPSQIDMAKMKSEFLYHFQKTHGTSFRNKLFGHIGKLNHIGTFFAPLSNWAAQSSFAKPLLNRLGIAPQRSLPLFASQRFSSWVKKQPRHIPKDTEVVLFCDTYSEFNTPQVAVDAYRLLSYLGYMVHVLPWVCCGRPLFSKGLLEQAQNNARKIIHQLHPYAKQCFPIIVLEPSCLSMLRDDYKSLLKDDKAETVSSASLSLDEFLHQHIQHSPFPHSLSSAKKNVAFHTHCHQKALIGSRYTLEVLQSIPGITPIELLTGCCGLAGSFGYEKEHYDFSMKIGEDRLFPSIRTLPQDTQIIASGMSCRSQIQHGTNRHAQHLAEFLAGHFSLYN